MVRTLVCIVTGLVLAGAVGCGMMGGSSATTAPTTMATTMMSH
jgi:hypothetical protein